jgi:hypothetical protein
MGKSGMGFHNAMEEGEGSRVFVDLMQGRWMISNTVVTQSLF